MRRSTASGAQGAFNNRALLWGFTGGVLRSCVVPNHDEVTTMIGRGRLYRVGRPQDREPLRAERKSQQNAEGERFHIAVLLCIICAIEIAKSLPWSQWVNHRRALR